MYRPIYKGVGMLMGFSEVVGRWFLFNALMRESVLKDDSSSRLVNYDDDDADDDGNDNVAMDDGNTELHRGFSSRKQ
ncbi:hypothetical protein M0802_004577 [Mischocyttarus mexicanus]|nr:hypothetical protein M0802_004577 [Mischocyttarus mexicanus]